jgi:hypothetical protein
MDKFLKLFILGILFSLYSCATSLSPIEVNKTLPTLTKSKFIPQSQIGNNCKLLVKSRSYVAPIGFTAKDDLKNAAKGIDEWVTIDGGNGYFLKNYRWITVDAKGTTQLEVEFETMLCQ